VVFSVRSVPRLYNEDQLPLRKSLEMAVRKVEGWCEMVASLREREPEAKQHPLLEVFARQHSEDCD
jgi:hypothetical protein